MSASVADCGLSSNLSSFSPAYQPVGAVDFTVVAGALKISASLRKTWTAMIATPVRIKDRLIALFTSAQPSLPASNVEGLHFLGLCEDDIPRFHNGPGRVSASAGKIPLSRGKSAALVFDVGGLVTWLKDRYPRSTIYHVESDTGIPAASVENWLHRRTQPSVQHFSILIRYYGPSLLAACFETPPQWVDEAMRQERRREIDAQIAKFERERKTVGGAA